MTLNKNSEVHKQIEALVKEEGKNCRNRDSNNCSDDQSSIEKGDSDAK